MSLFNKFFLIFGVFLLGFFAGHFYKQPFKTAIKYFYQDEFNELSYKCDNAMREHFLARLSLYQNQIKKMFKT